MEKITVWWSGLKLNALCLTYTIRVCNEICKHTAFGVAVSFLLPTTFPPDPKCHTVTMILETRHFFSEWFINKSDFNNSACTLSIPYEYLGKTQHRKLVIRKTNHFCSTFGPIVWLKKNNHALLYQTFITRKYWK